MTNSGKPLLAQKLLAPEVNESRVKHDELSIHTVFIPIHPFFIPPQLPGTTALQCFQEFDSLKEDPSLHYEPKRSFASRSLRVLAKTGWHWSKSKLGLGESR